MCEIKTALRSIAIISILAWAGIAAAETCETDDDCESGEYCLMAPCAAVACDPDDEDCTYECDEVGECTDEGDWWGYEDCETDDDCAEGWVCEVVGAVACTDVACPDGVECPESPPCEEEEWSECVPDLMECETDAECPEELVCISVISGSCSGSAVECPPGTEDCPEPEEPVCEEEEESFCAPSYIAPCEKDEDCGEGFTCEEAEMCECSGGGAVSGGSSGSTGTDDDSGDDGGDDGGGDEDHDDGFECDCSGTDEYYCQPQEIDCTEDADCPDGWSCMTAPSPSAPCYYDAETEETFCEDTEPEGAICFPPDYGYWGVGGRSGYGEAAADASGVDEINWDVPEEQGGGSGTSGSGSGSSESDDDSSCQQVSGTAGFGLTLLALLTLAGVLRRSRVRASSK